MAEAPQSNALPPPPSAPADHAASFATWPVAAHAMIAAMQADYAALAAQSQAQFAAMQAQLAQSLALASQSQAALAQAQAQLAAAVAKTATLERQLRWLQRQIFGQKSERLSDLPGELLPGLDLTGVKEPPGPPPMTVPEHTRQPTKCHGQQTLDWPADLPRVEQLVDVPEAERTLADGTKLVKIGEDRSLKLAFRPSEYYLKEIVRPRYADPRQPHLGVVQEIMPPSLITASKFDDSFMAHIVIQKFVYHLPLYRLVEHFASRELRISLQTLSQLVMACGQRVIPLVKLMNQRLLQSGCLWTDDTPLKMQSAGRCREVRVWVYVGALPQAPPYHVYRFSPDRSHRHPQAHLAEFQGVLHADAFGAYETLANAPGSQVQWAACWAHARRKFEELPGNEHGLRDWVLGQIRKLFLYERLAWRHGPETRLWLRRDRELPLVDALYARLREAVAGSLILPRSGLGGAIGYLQRYEKHFRLYLSDARVRMDNNPAERAVRKLTIGRKNWMFVGSEAAGESMAALLSLTQTCRAMGINPQSYLEDLFRQLLDSKAKDLAQWLPDAWQARQLATAPVPDQAPVLPDDAPPSA